MRPIRIDENSTDNALKEVFEMQSGEVFGVAEEFLEHFMREIPRDRYFKFSPIKEGTAEYNRYGSNCYKVICNEKVIILK